MGTHDCIAHPPEVLPSPWKHSCQVNGSQVIGSLAPSLFTSWFSSRPITQVQTCLCISAVCIVRVTSVKLLSPLQKRFNHAENVRQCDQQRVQLYRWHVDRKKKVKNRSSNMQYYCFWKLDWICIFKFFHSNCIRYFLISLNRQALEKD